MSEHLEKLRSEFQAWVANGGDIHGHYYVGYMELTGVLEAVQELLEANPSPQLGSFHE